MIRAAIYIRVSTEEQYLHGLSLDAQREALIEYAKKNDMQIVDVYADEGITARKRLDKRLQFQRLISDVKQDKIDLILVTKLDRWFRNIKDYHNTQEILEAHNCNWKTIFENYDTSTAGGRLHINIMLAVNQDECDRTSERIKAVFKHKISNSEVTSGAHPAGFKIENKHLVIDENTVHRVRDLFNYYERTACIGETVAYNNAHYPKINKRSLKLMLKNEKYVGKYRDNVNYCPAIISHEQFEHVQHLLNRNVKMKGAVKEYDYIFSRMVCCKYCGSSMSGTYTINKPRKDGSRLKVYLYGCNSNRLAKQCDNGYKPTEKAIEKYLLENIAQQLQDYTVSFQIKAQQQKKADNTAAISRLKAKLNKLKDLYLDDLIDKAEYKRSYEDMQAQISLLESDTPTPTHNIDASAVQAILSADFKDIYETLTNAEKRRLWLSVIDYIVVGKNKNDITIHFL